MNKQVAKVIANVLAVLLAIALASVAFAAPKALFDTPEEAATTALRYIAGLPTGTVYEWGGVIAKTPDGHYVASAPRTDYSGDSVQLRRGELLGLELVGGYHTHPCIPGHAVEFFSPEDLLEVIFEHYPATFMGDFCTGNVHEFKRGDKPDTEKLTDIWLTKGRIVGKFTTPAPRVADAELPHRVEGLDSQGHQPGTPEHPCAEWQTPEFIDLVPGIPIFLMCYPIKGAAV